MDNNLRWLDIEKSINIEINWLKNNIIPYSKDINPLNYSNDVFYRLIAILIVSGNTKVTEYLYKNNYNFNDLKVNIDKKHGANWHNNMINHLASYFLKLGYLVELSEPKLYYGHSDLKIIKNNKKIYFEIDTISIFKLWINLLKTKDRTIIVITQNKIIKFES